MRSPVYGLAVTTVLLLCGIPASAQTASSSSTSGSTSSSSADAAAQAAAAAIARGGSAHNQSSFRSPRAPGAIGLPGLAASGGCMGSTSLGASFIGGGVGIGSSWQDQRCNAREDARLLAAFGYREQALQLLINNSPMIAQVMGPPVAAVAPRVVYKPVSLNPDEHVVNGVRQVYREPALDNSLPEKCRATLALLQQQDDYLKGVVASRGKVTPTKLHNASLVQENLRTGIGNVQVLCPATVSRQVSVEVAERISQIDAYLATGKWSGPVG